jgi:cell division protein FtsN
VSYAAVLSLERARDIAAGITVLGERARIVTGETGGTTVYRVVMGPYQSRDAAERIGKASGHSYWVYEGVP